MHVLLRSVYASNLPRLYFRHFSFAAHLFATSSMLHGRESMISISSIVVSCMHSLLILAAHLWKFSASLLVSRKGNIRSER
jgi:hypothetical protein